MQSRNWTYDLGVGATIGSIVPGLGTAICGFFGGLIGGIVGGCIGSDAGKEMGTKIVK